MNYFFIVSEKAKKSVILQLRSIGKVIFVYENKNLAAPVCCHPDMQIAQINSETCVHSPDMRIETINEMKNAGIEMIEGFTKLKPVYPGNIAYNVLKVGKNIYHNTKYTDSVLIEYLKNLKYVPVNIKQGYAGCSSIYLKDILITNDKGIEKKAAEQRDNCYRFDGSEIILKGYDRGFIGGCSGYDEALGFLTTGKIGLLKEGHELTKILHKRNIKVTELSNEIPEDTGGIQIYKL